MNESINIKKFLAVHPMFKELNIDPPPKIMLARPRRNFFSPAQGLIVVVEGLVLAYRVDHKCRRIGLGIHGPGAVLNMAALGTAAPQLYLDAIGEVKYLFFPLPVIAGLKKNPVFESRLFEACIKHADELEGLVVIGSLLVRQRVAICLRKLAKNFGVNDRSRGWLLPKGLTHEIIAVLCSTSRETASQAIAELRKVDKVVTDKQKIFVTNRLIR